MSSFRDYQENSNFL